MGSIDHYQSNAGRRYRVRFRKPDNSQTSKRGFKTKREAELYVASLEISKARGEFIDASASRITVGDYGKAWIAARTHLKPSTARVEESTWRVHVLSRWDATPIGTVRHSDIQAWLGMIPKSPTIVRHAHAILSAILATAVRDRRIPSNPAVGIKLPRKVGKERVYLSHVQVDALAEQSRDHRALVLLLAYTGLRWGEATGLRVRDVDLARRRLMVRENAVAVGGKIIVGSPKSHKARSVPFPAFLGVELSLIIGSKDSGLILFGNGFNYQRSPDTRDGWYSGACKRVQLSDPSFPEHITLHDLRHTAASLAISSGANVKAVQRMLGHASAAMTLDTYADLFDDDLDAVADALGEARRVSVVAKPWPDGTIATPEMLGNPSKQRHVAPRRSVPPAGFEPAAKTLEGSCSIP
jgi:integrase